MEFLVEFEMAVPEDVGTLDVAFHEREVALAAERLAAEGHLLRIWTVPNGLEKDRVFALYRARDVDELDDILDNLPLHEWVNVVITRLESHPNDPYRPDDNK